MESPRDRPENEKGASQIEITPETLGPEKLAAFRDLFQEWLLEGRNQDCLEVGALGDLDSLAARAHSWALE